MKNRKPFTQVQKVPILAGFATVLVAFLAWNVFGDAIVGITLRSNDALQNGLISHYHESYASRTHRYRDGVQSMSTTTYSRALDDTTAQTFVIARLSDDLDPAGCMR